MADGTAFQRQRFRRRKETLPPISYISIHAHNVDSKIEFLCEYSVRFASYRLNPRYSNIGLLTLVGRAAIGGVDQGAALFPQGTLADCSVSEDNGTWSDCVRIDLQTGS